MPKYPRFDWLSIEPEGPSPHMGCSHVGGFIVVGHYTAPRSSVLAGRQMRQRLGHFSTVEEALAEWPKAEVQEGCHNPLLEPPLPDTGSVDPSIAGEVWGEDDY